jgi:hypothetical protein
MQQMRLLLLETVEQIVILVRSLQLVVAVVVLV